MYIRKTNRTTHKKYSIDEKNQIVLLYLDRHMGVAEIVRRYDLAHDTILYRWVNQYKQYGTCVDNRGKCSKLQNPKKGRPRKTPEKTLEECSKEELNRLLKQRGISNDKFTEDLKTQIKNKM